MLLYSSVINVLSGIIEVAGSMVRKGHPRKFFRFLRGQKGLTRHIRSTFRDDPARQTVWIHAASFGEFSVARPLITELKHRGMQIVVTFFSPSGYEALEHHHPHVDHLYYLPFDTTHNAETFLDIVKPDKAVFIVSEYWFNYLQLLRQRGIDTYLVSAKISQTSIFFRWYGKLYRRCLPTYKHFFVIDEQSRSNLKKLGYENVSIPGNPLFDNAIAKSQEEWSDEVIERFASGGDVFIAGSIHDDNDMRLVSDLANAHPEVKFLFVPHEITDSSIAQLRSMLCGKSALHSQSSPDTDFADTQVLVVDYMGSLAYIYRYAKWAYVGGGFTRYLHSLIEATVYGIPVAFGPQTHRKVTPQEISERGLGQVVSTSEELDGWFSALKDNPEALRRISEKAKAYVAENAGATDTIVDAIISTHKAR